MPLQQVEVEPDYAPEPQQPKRVRMRTPAQLDALKKAQEARRRIAAQKKAERLAQEQQLLQQMVNDDHDEDYEEDEQVIPTAQPTPPERVFTESQVRTLYAQMEREREQYAQQYAQQYIQQYKPPEPQQASDYFNDLGGSRITNPHQTHLQRSKPKNDYLAQQNKIAINSSKPASSFFDSLF